MVEAYAGITAQANRHQRPLTHIAKRYYGGSKERAIADGWQVQFVFDLVDPNFWMNRYNLGWGEHTSQKFLRDHPKVIPKWGMLEPIPIYGENRSNLSHDTRYIGLYLCLRFV